MEDSSNQFVRLIDLAIALGKATKKVELAEQERSKVEDELSSQKKQLEGLSSTEYPVVVARNGSTYVINKISGYLNYAIASQVIEVKKEDSP